MTWSPQDKNFYKVMGSNTATTNGQKYKTKFLKEATKEKAKFSHGPLPASFSFNYYFSSIFHTIKIGDFSRIQTGIIRRARWSTRPHNGPMFNVNVKNKDKKKWMESLRR